MVRTSSTSRTGAPAGSRGLGLFLMPKRLDDGSRNGYRIVRLKDKLGSKSMASGEIVFEGAVAYQVGELDQGLKQMLVMVNSSRVSHLTRAAGMMRPGTAVVVLDVDHFKGINDGHGHAAYVADPRQRGRLRGGVVRTGSARPQRDSGAR